MDTRVEFYREMRRVFMQTAATHSDTEAKVRALTERAFDLFERNIAIQLEDLPALACEKGCSACCVLRVTASAPEIFLLASYVELIEASPQGAALDLRARIKAASRATKGLGEAERLTLGLPCAFMLRGVCVIHPVRPLACRGHASFDAGDCSRAAMGEDIEVAISEPHLIVRGLVQNALQSALRQSGLAWGLYELNRGLALALDGRNRRSAWANGADSLGPSIPDLDMAALAEAFDQLTET